MILVKIHTTLNFNNEDIQNDLARRITLSFKLCYPNHLFNSNQLHILFLPISAYFEGTRYIRSNLSSSSGNTTTTTTTTTPSSSLLHLDVIVPALAEYENDVLKHQILTRLTKEVDDWIASLFHSDHPISSDHSTLLNVIPIIEYRQMKYGSHAIDGEVVMSPYGVM